MNTVYLKLRILKFENNKRRFKNKIRKTIAAIDDKRLHSVNICIQCTIITKILIIFNL